MQLLPKVVTTYLAVSYASSVASLTASTGPQRACARGAVVARMRSGGVLLVPCCNAQLTSAMPSNRVGTAGAGELPATSGGKYRADPEALSRAQPGDVLLFRAHTKASGLTKAVTRSGFSHAGVLAPFQEPGGKLALYEACRVGDGVLLH